MSKTCTLYCILLVAVQVSGDCQWYVCRCWPSSVRSNGRLYAREPALLLWPLNARGWLQYRVSKPYNKSYGDYFSFLRHLCTNLVDFGVKINVQKLVNRKSMWCVFRTSPFDLEINIKESEICRIFLRLSVKCLPFYSILQFTHRQLEYAFR